MEILSFGNQLQIGEYKLHSRFNSAINFISGDDFIFVVNKGVGAGPVNIVVNGKIPESIDFLEIEDTCFKLNGEEFKFESDKQYDSSIDLSKFEYDLFVNNLGIVEKAVIEKASPHSLSFLLRDVSDNLGNATTPLPPFAKRDFEGAPNTPMGEFEIESRRIIRAGVQQILYGDIFSGVKMIKGLGPGLTPSGDDFNSGLLIAMNVVKGIEEGKQGFGVDHEILRQVGAGSAFAGMTSANGIPAFAGMTRKSAGMKDEGEEITPRLRRPPLLRGNIESVYEAARGRNLFTNSFLSCAAKGQLFFKFRKLVGSLLHSNVNEIINNTELVLTMGETSGADQLSGFLIGMKRLIK